MYNLLLFLIWYKYHCLLQAGRVKACVDVCRVFLFLSLMLSFCVILESVFYFLLFIRGEYLLYSILMVLCLVSWNFILRGHV